ncbi:MAG: hypothetical protein LC797_03195 [Chloroflexi bacterium]|nr:hypothetical protein [Chloroflexota bacterium]
MAQTRQPWWAPVPRPRRLWSAWRLGQSSAPRPGRWSAPRPGRWSAPRPGRSSAPRPGRSSAWRPGRLSAWPPGRSSAWPAATSTRSPQERQRSPRSGTSEASYRSLLLFQIRSQPRLAERSAPVFGHTAHTASLTCLCHP